VLLGPLLVSTGLAPSPVQGPAVPPTRREAHPPPSFFVFALSLFCFFNRSHGPLTVTDPKGPNQSLRDVKIHVWKWSWALTSRLGAVLGRKGDDHDRGVRR